MVKLAEEVRQHVVPKGAPNERVNLHGYEVGEIKG